MVSERIENLAALAKARGEAGMPTHFLADLHSSALGRFKDLPQCERLARSMAFAIDNQPVFAYEGDGLGGRIYYNKEQTPEELCPLMDWERAGADAFKKICPEADELRRVKMISWTSKGHITWRYDKLLEKGVIGFRRELEEYLANPKDEEARQFYQGALMILDALQTFNDKHIAEYERLGNTALAERMKRVPLYPAESFRDAVQSYFMQHIVIMRENPFGGNSPGRLDYFLWPYLERDLDRGAITLAEAKEIIDELFLRIDERIYNSDGWGETIVVGGTMPDGSSAINPLSYIMIDSIMDLNITHPLLYVRLPKDPPAEMIDKCAKYLVSGNNRAQIIYDPAIMAALMKIGVPYSDAVHFYCGGCMEIGIQGMNSDLLYVGWINTPKMLELMITGGICLLSGKRYPAFVSEKGLAGYSDFESFYSDFIAEATRLIHLGLKEQDCFSKASATMRPSFLISALMNDCLERGRNMHSGGARYHDYGETPLGMPDMVDGLFAVKKAVFDLGICGAEELISAMKANFDGYDALRAKLQAIPKYGMDDDECDQLGARVMKDFADAYASFTTIHGGHGKPMILTFTYAPQAAKMLGARADGSLAGAPVSHGVTPRSQSMTKGITAAVNSVVKMPFESFSGGATTMWDFDSSFVTEDIVKAILLTFIDKGGQIFQGNTTSVEDLLKAKNDPDNYKHLIVRVGGYSARFVNLNPDLQNEIINRMRHSS